MVLGLSLVYDSIMASVERSYWCHICSRIVRVRGGDTVHCYYCDSGFVEDINNNSPRLSQARADMYFDHRSNDSISRARINSRSGNSDRQVFNPVIVLRGNVVGERGNYELYYDDGTGSSLQPLPPTMSEFLMGNGLDRLLDQLAHLDLNGEGGFKPPPASKAAIESLPTIKIDSSHVGTDLHCAVCKEAFEIDCEAREMPCKHIYHADCILPWLSLRNSCPVCRHELEADDNAGVAGGERLTGLSDETPVGLTIWRLPGGGYAVGRFTGSSEAEPPLVFTEMDGGFSGGGGGAPRRIAWSRGVNRARGRSRMGRAFRNFFSYFRRFRISSRNFSLEIGFR